MFLYRHRHYITYQPLMISRWVSLFEAGVYVMQYRLACLGVSQTDVVYPCVNLALGFADVVVCVGIIVCHCCLSLML